MRKFVISVFVVGLLGGPLASLGNANPGCRLAEKLGFVNVKECE